MKIKTDNVKITTRQRTEVSSSDISSLAESMGRIGLLNPIIIDETNTLIAGFCRLSAARQLGWAEIEAKAYNSLTAIEKQEIELEENIKRKQLTWSEECLAVAKIHSLRNNTVRQTGALLHKPISVIQEQLNGARVLQTLPELSKAKSLRKALMTYKRVEGALLSGLLEAEMLSSQGLDFVNADCVEYVKGLPDESIDLVLTDPPFGIGLTSNPTIKPYADSETNLFETLSALFPELYRVLKPGRHVYVFMCDDQWNDVRLLLKNAGFKTREKAIVWNKGRATAAFGHQTTTWLSQHQLIIFAYKDFERPLNSSSCVNAMLEFPPPQNRFHPFELPEGLCSKLIEISSYPGESVLDCFAGSGIILKQALTLGRLAFGCEIDKTWFGHARYDINASGEFYNVKSDKP